MDESSGTREPWVPGRWPADSAAAERLRQWLVQRGKDSGAVLYGLDLDFRGADLSDADFTESWLSRSDLRGARLQRVVLWCAHAERADFSGADLERADLVKASLLHANFSRATLAHADLGRAEALGAAFVDANLAQADLGDAGFTEADLTGADLTGALADKLGLTHCRLDGARVAGFHGSVIGPIIVSDHGKDIELDDEDLERWFTERGANVTRFHAEPNRSTG